MTLDKPALEGTVIERKGVKVKELIEKLQKLDPDLLVCAVDNEYGEQFDLNPIVVTADYDYSALRLVGLGKGDPYVQIN